MFKKLLLATITTATLGFSAAVFAGSFYIGPSILIQDATTNSSSYRGLSPKATLGYGEMGDTSYFAGEVFVSPGNATLTDTHLPGAASIKTSRSFGASIIPGMIIGPQALGFLRLGFITSKFSGPDIYKTGGQLGLGLMTTVSPDWDVRGEYDYSIYGQVDGLGSPKVDEFVLGFLYRFDY